MIDIPFYTMSTEQKSQFSLANGAGAARSVTSTKKVQESALAHKMVAALVGSVLTSAVGK